jgi:plasmid stabilization system protein ParE
MSIRVEFHRLAQKEYLDARRWYAERSLEAAANLTIAVNHAISRIRANPEGFSKIAKQFHYVRVTGFPYILTFRQLEPELILVHAMAHTSRRPGYWRKRRFD